MSDAWKEAWRDAVLQVPVRLVREIAGIAIEVPEVHDADLDLYDPLLVAAMPWAVLYRSGAEDGPLHVEGFVEKDQLSERVAALYRAGEIVAVLHAGKPVRFNMRVKARIG